MYINPPPGSRLFLDFTRDQFCGKVLDRSGMCGEPAFLTEGNGELPRWRPEGLEFGNLGVVEHENTNTDISTATKQKPLIHWIEFTPYEMETRVMWHTMNSPSVARIYAYTSSGGSLSFVSYGSDGSENTVLVPYEVGKRNFAIWCWDGEKATLYNIVNSRIRMAAVEFAGPLRTGEYFKILVGRSNTLSPYRGIVSQCGVAQCNIIEFLEWYRSNKDAGLRHASATDFGLYFDGSTYVDFGGDINISDNLTIELLYKPLPGSSLAAFVKGSNAAWTENAYGLRTVAGRMRFFISDADRNALDEVNFNVPREGDTVHIAGVAGPDRLYAYLDYQTAGWAERTVSRVKTIPGSLVLGRSYSGASLLNGYVYQARIWNRALTLDELKRYRGKIVTGAEGGLVGCWNFFEESGDIVKDYSGNENDGTIIGTANWHGVPTDGHAGAKKG